MYIFTLRFECTPIIIRIFIKSKNDHDHLNEDFDFFNLKWPLHVLLSDK